jgi:hypothetical protein
MTPLTVRMTAVPLPPTMNRPLFMQRTVPLPLELSRTVPLPLTVDLSSDR